MTRSSINLLTCLLSAASCHAADAPLEYNVEGVGRYEMVYRGTAYPSTGTLDGNVMRVTLFVDPEACFGFEETVECRRGPETEVYAHESRIAVFEGRSDAIVAELEGHWRDEGFGVICPKPLRQARNFLRAIGPYELLDAVGLSRDLATPAVVDFAVLIDVFSFSSGKPEKIGVFQSETIRARITAHSFEMRAAPIEAQRTPQTRAEPNQRAEPTRGTPAENREARWQDCARCRVAHA